MTDIFPSEKQIEEAVKNSNEMGLIKSYFRENFQRDAPEEVFDYMLELYNDLPHILPTQNTYKRKKFVIRKTIEYIIDNFAN